MATELFKEEDLFELHSAVQAMKRAADAAANVAAGKARDKKEAAMLADLRRQYGGKTLYCYDEARQTNRFATQPPREWNAVAFSFEECVNKMRPHICRQHSVSHWESIERQLDTYRAAGELPSLEPENRLVLAAGDYWYCFFCLTGDEYCDKVVAYLVGERKEDARRASQSCACCSVD